MLQVITLNVAINSHSPALLPLLLSNQFVEIKGSVFKRYTVEGLFQLSCGGKSWAVSSAILRHRLTPWPCGVRRYYEQTLWSDSSW